MVIKPRIRGFICTTAHPVGCAAIVNEQIRWTGSQAPLVPTARRTCWWSAARRATVSPRGSWRPSAAARARSACRSRRNRRPTVPPAPAGTTTARSTAPRMRPGSTRGPSAPMRSPTPRRPTIADAIKRDLGGIDLLVYSLASPVRTDPDSGVLYRSAIKPVGRTVHIKSLNVDKGVVHDVDLAPATDEEIAATVKVMGGEDWERWISVPAGARASQPGVQDRGVHLHRQRADLADLLGGHARQGQGGPRSRRHGDARRHSAP